MGGVPEPDDSIGLWTFLTLNDVELTDKTGKSLATQL